MRHRFPPLPHVKYVLSRGKWYAYFNTGKAGPSGAPVYTRLPHPAAVGFYDSYASCMAGRTRRAVAEYTVTNLIADYERSVDFLKTAINTQIGYRITMDKIDRTLGEFPVTELQNHDVQTVLDGEGWGASTQNLFVAVLRNMFKWARKRQKTDLDPMRDYERQKGSEHQPWAADVLAAGLKADDDRTRLAIHLLYYTGQRIGDVCAMRWNDIQDGVIHITQQKTGKEMEIPIHAKLRAELAKAPKQGITILTGAGGKRIGVTRLRDTIQAFTADLGSFTVPHGLRKNAVNALLEAGCSIAEVSAITGQGFQIVEHYAAKVNRRKLGKTAILKFEKSA